MERRVTLLLGICWEIFVGEYPNSLRAFYTYFRRIVCVLYSSYGYIPLSHFYELYFIS